MEEVGVRDVCARGEMGGRPLPREELETAVVGEDFQVFLGERRGGGG